MSRDEEDVLMFWHAAIRYFIVCRKAKVYLTGCRSFFFYSDELYIHLYLLKRLDMFWHLHILHSASHYQPVKCITAF